MTDTSFGAHASRRGMLCALAAASGLALGGGTGAAAAPGARRVMPGTRPDAAKAREIRDEFLHAWEGYKRFAWGHDEVLPVSGGHREFFARGHPVGLSIVEALDTHHLMGLDDEADRCVRWIVDHLDFDIDADFQVFEATIRLVGGLLAGHLATGRRALLDLCADLTDRLLPAFTASPTGMPYRYVNLRTGRVSGAVSPVAEIGTHLLEFSVLSELTGDPRYRRAAKRAVRALVERRSGLDLLATTMNVETGRWADRQAVAVDPPADSFYEYLWGAWEMFGDEECRDWFRMLDDALRRHQAERADGLLWFRHVDFGTGATTSRRQSSLAVAILPVGGDPGLAADYYRSWTAVLDKYSVIPEQIDYTRLQAVDPRNELRPEYANCAFQLYWQTGEAYYRTTAWRYFQNLRKYHRVPGGYTVVADVTRRPMPQGDHCPAYVFAENFKWLYLTFADTPRFDYAHGYLSTEGKVLRGLRRA
ncbi:glycoside hydrolase family 47 protein [Streptomyces triculaminicus]|uniref:Glycoside hydrolase family 47 protein n=2 Tax=Streptomyces TaxID=1883 RepID=A0A939JLL5_9ACTN|nr:MULTISPECIES: glycoside hydrolase family 47 protein [Streptomyces]MBO0651418.1 glycoside hydrolase family 47 protein [Streptomyces triculaminicus]QSY49726.1 glycoside hydrolase family 47 protein [Streptomyces griseocarneus]